MKDPYWNSEAYLNDSKKQADEMSAISQEPVLLAHEVCSEIAEALNMDKPKFKLIVREVYEGLRRRKVARIVGPEYIEAFSTLRRISDKLTEVAEELNGANIDLHRLLYVAYSSRSERGMKSGLQNLIDPLMPADREWVMAYVEERLDGTSENYALELIESVHRPIRMLLGLKPRKPRGSPGRSLRNAVIRELATAYEEIVGEIPTGTPSGQFTLLCQLTLDALGMDDTGLESAVQRVLHDLKQADLHPHK
jgi:hypothetical protein